WQRPIPHHPAHQRTSRRPLLPPLKSIFLGPSPPTTSASPAIEWNAARGLAARTSRKSPRRQPPSSMTLAWLLPLLIPTACAPLTPAGISAPIRARGRPQLRRTDQRADHTGARR